MIKCSIVLIALYKNARLKYGKTLQDINLEILSIDPSIMVENNLSVFEHSVLLRILIEPTTLFNDV